MRHPERPAMQPAALRRGPRFGPGLLLAIVAGALVWNLASRAPQKPAVEHTTHPVEAGAALSAPEPAWLVSHAAMLKLSASQLSALQGMAARWGHNTKALRMELGTASARFETSAQVHAHGADMAAIRQEAGSVSELTRQLLDARQAWWSATKTLLTPTQRRQAEEAWASRFTAGKESAQK